MKVGVHAGEPLDSIISRKQQEEQSAGFFLWGYGGTLCHPLTQIGPYVGHAQSLSRPIQLAMVQTKSAHFGTAVAARESSTDAKIWMSLPSSIQVTGSRFALVCKRVTRVDRPIDLARYSVAVGPSRGRKVVDYMRGRVDKACGVQVPADEPPRWAPVSYLAELVSPFAVFVR